MADIRQSRPGSGLGFLVNVLRKFGGVPSPLGSGAVVAPCDAFAAPVVPGEGTPPWDTILSKDDQIKTFLAIEFTTQHSLH